MSPSTSQDAIYSSSPLSEYSVTVPDLDAPGGARRSTSASDALQYYWSSSAGERSGSVGSNLALSPIDLPSSSHILTSPYSLSSPHSLAPLSTSPMMAHHKSDVSLRDLVAEEQEQGRQRAAAANGASTEYNAPLEDPRRSVPRDHDVSSAGQSNRHIHLVSYPSDGSLQSAAHHRRSSRASSNSGESEYSDCERDDPPEKPIQRRTSPMSQQRPRGLVDAEGRLDVMLDPSFEEWAHQRAWDGGENKSSSAPISPSDAAAPGAASDRWHTPVTTLLERRRATRTPSPQGDRTPRNSAPSGTQTPRASLPKSGRLLFVASPEVSRRSIDALEREARAVDGLGLDTTQMPHSAPAIKTGFGDILLPEPRRPTSLLPSVQMRSQARHTLRPPNSDAGLNARRSPEPPPRSELRKQRTRTLTPPQGPIPGRSAREPSPRSHTAPLPGDRARSDSTQKTNMRESGTIQDLTKILGGAIDEIGLIDSRDTPPPNIEVPPKQRLPLRLSQVPVRSASSHVNALPVHSPEQQFSQLSPLSPTGQVQGDVANKRAWEHAQREPGRLGPNEQCRIKQLKTPGDRARAYAQSVAELQRTDSGLREWLYPQYPIRPAMPRPAVAAQSGLGLGLRPPDQQQRIVSGSSEFPIRVDAYSARELSVRNLEPADAPTALPSNLPYPTLQQHVKGSNSMQSLTSLSSYKPQPRGLGRAFNFLKREKENASLTSLGPANPQAFAPSMGGSKRELRNMPISGPYSPAAGRSSLDSIEGPRVQPSLAVPRGPREVPGRASHEIQRTSADRQRSPVPGPHGASPLAQRDHNTSDEEVRAMSEMLPHGERAVLRAYLQTYGEPSYALTAYIEDEKNGTLMRAA
ncbi:hypothetical protein CcaverHIS002_0303830 [Cutaneotrichosporon cavernicola]|nr:hypothetical protein CcaverHIS002_0303830 [Cutaneotrichosporon cavernicola]